jgi:hypothetical protein
MEDPVSNSRIHYTVAMEIQINKEDLTQAKSNSMPK